MADEGPAADVHVLHFDQPDDAKAAEGTGKLRKRNKSRTHTNTDALTSGLNAASASLLNLTDMFAAKVQRGPHTFFNAVASDERAEVYETVTDPNLPEIHLLTRDKNGRTGLHIAAQEHNLEMIKLLLGLPVENPTSGGGTLQLRDCDMPPGEPGVTEIREALTAGLLDQYGNSPLLQSTKSVPALTNRKGERSNVGLEIVKLLLEHGDSVNTQAKSGMTCVHWIGYWGELETLHFLLEDQWGFDPLVTDNHNTTAMELAGISANKNRDFRNLLKAIPEEERSRSQSDALLRNHSECCKMLVRHAIANLQKRDLLETDSTNQIKRALLVYATECGMERELVQLMEVGVDPAKVYTSKRTPYPITALHTAAAKGKEEELLAILSHLQKDHTEPLDTVLPDWGIETRKIGCRASPIHYAAVAGHRECLKILLTHEPSLDQDFTSTRTFSPAFFAQETDMSVFKHRPEFLSSWEQYQEQDMEYVIVFEGHQTLYRELIRKLSLQRTRKGLPLKVLEFPMKHFNKTIRSLKDSEESEDYTNRKRTMLVFTMENDELLQMAAQQQLKVALRNSDDITTFEFERRDDFLPLMPRQRQLIVKRALRAKFDLDSYFKNGMFKDYFLLHDHMMVSRILGLWVWDPATKRSLFPPFSNKMWKKMFTSHAKSGILEEIRSLRNYVGKPAAIMLGWTCFYTSWLIIPLFFGLVAFFVRMDIGDIMQSDFKWFEYHDSLHFYAILVSLWFSVVLEQWKRKKAEVQYAWREAQTTAGRQQDRPDHQADESVNVTTGLKGYSYHWADGISRMVLTWPPIFVLTFICGLCFVGTSLLQAAKKDDDNFRYAMAILNGFVVAGLNEAFLRIARMLVDRENHAKESDYQHSLIIKIFLFQFVNSFFMPFYLAYYKKEFDQLSVSLLGLVMSQVSVDIVAWIVWPWLLTRTKLRMRKLEHQYEHLKHTLYGDMEALEALGSAAVVPADGGRTPRNMNVLELNVVLEIEDCMYPPIDLNELFATKVMQISYVVVFAAACPLAPLCAVFLNVIQIRETIYSMCLVHRRMDMSEAAYTSTWLDLLSLVNNVGLVNNVLLLYFSTDKYREDSVAKDWTDAAASNSSETNLNVLWTLLILEHLLFAVKAFIAEAIPDKPSYVTESEEADRKFTSQKEQLLSDAHAKRVSKRQEEKKRLKALRKQQRADSAQIEDDNDDGSSSSSSSSSSSDSDSDDERVSSTRARRDMKRLGRAQKQFDKERRATISMQEDENLEASYFQRRSSPDEEEMGMGVSPGDKRQNDE